MHFTVLVASLQDAYEVGLGTNGNSACTIREVTEGEIKMQVGKKFNCENKQLCTTNMIVLSLQNGREVI